MAMFSPDYANASSWAWNVTMDRQLPWQHFAQVSYVGRSASNLERARNINQLQPGTLQSNPNVNANALRPYPGFGTITLYETTGRSRYDALQLQVQQLHANLSYSLAYTFSRTTDDGDPAGDSAERLRRQRVLRSLRYRSAARADYPGVVPDAHTGIGFSTRERRARRLAPRRRVPGAVGRPLRRHDHGGHRWRRPGSARSTDNIVGDPEEGRTEFDGTRAVWFNKAAFQAPAAGTYATTWERNNLRQPGFWDLHTSLRKSVSLGPHRVELRWDVFNVLNHTTLGVANSNPTSPDFGTITSRTGSRTMQIGLQYVF